MLPSGKPSGFYIFSITEDEINDLVQDLQPEEKPKKFFTWSEWALYTALRRKYGVTYLNPKTKQERFLSTYDISNDSQEEENAIEELEEKLTFYCDCRLNDILKLACQTAENAQLQRDTEESEDIKKNFRSSLDNSDFDVLY